MAEQRYTDLATFWNLKLGCQGDKEKLKSQVLLWVSWAREDLKFMGKGARDGHYAQESEASELNGASVKGGLMGREEGKQG